MQLCRIDPASCPCDCFRVCMLYNTSLMSRPTVHVCTSCSFLSCMIVYKCTSLTVIPHMSIYQLV